MKCAVGRGMEGLHFYAVEVFWECVAAGANDIIGLVERAPGPFASGKYLPSGFLK